MHVCSELRPFLKEGPYKSPYNFFGPSQREFTATLAVRSWMNVVIPSPTGKVLPSGHPAATPNSNGPLVDRLFPPGSQNI